MIPPSGKNIDLICFSHLRWNFVFQRPQHLMTRCARDRRVFFFEEPIYRSGIAPQLEIDTGGPVAIVVPHLPEGLSQPETIAAQRRLLDELIAARAIEDYLFWYYTPMALAFSDHLTPAAIVYDCMDELSAFKGAPAM